MNTEEIATKGDLAKMEQRILQAIFDKVKTKDRTLNIDEAVKHIHAKNRSTIYKLTSSGELAYLKVGKALVFWESDLNRYLAKRRKSSNDEISASAALRSIS
jgi:excisionase family DNA binding protein